MIILFVALPLVAAFLIPLLEKTIRKAGEMLALLVPLFLTGYAVVLRFEKLPKTVAVGGWKPPFGIVVAVDSLSVMMLLLINLVVLLSTFYSLTYMKRYTARWKFDTLLMLMLAGMNGILITGDLFNMFVFFEIAAISSYALVAFGTESEELEASFKYMVMGALASAAFLLAIGILYSKTSTLNLADIAARVKEEGLSPSVKLALALMLGAFSVKAAAVPFHAWLPDAHPSAPAPISAILSGIFIKTLGLYAIMRIFYNVFGLPPLFGRIILWLGLLSIVAGGLSAFAQKDLKRLLAYSSISQIGFVLVGLGIANRMALAGALIHLFAHGLGKASLFLTSGSLEFRLGTRDMNNYGGLSRFMPYSAFSFTTSALSVAGVPPMLGFFGKLFIVIGALQAGDLALAIAVVVLSLLTLGYMLKADRKTFFSSGNIQTREAPFCMVVSAVLLSCLLIIAGLTIYFLMEGLFLPAADVLLQKTAYIDTILGVIP